MKFEFCNREKLWQNVYKLFALMASIDSFFPISFAEGKDSSLEALTKTH